MKTAAPHKRPASSPQPKQDTHHGKHIGISAVRGAVESARRPESKTETQKDMPAFLRDLPPEST
ncbi:hypothetical protein [Methylovirgula sp. 4M-Z18]|uniref:hypothetical protein n=1 Tax=Methylovirgula sp. 4M-Z18 TaxID=2293567 RepID=UPI000E2F438A|nr:hypothetical protein [Methylovirgula sp. 4M-Z18]RFB80141.1 hypothetical protein DYH55_00915 [Methylovirgula sp. 4M-Z18]